MFLLSGRITILKPLSKNNSPFQNYFQTSKIWTTNFYSLDRGLEEALFQFFKSSNCKIVDLGVGQGGPGHCNEKNQDDIIKIITKKYQFVFDLEQSLYFRRLAKKCWLKNNICVFRKRCD